MKSNTYDLLVLGAGPAGLAAGIYGARSLLKVGIVDKGTPGGQIATTNEVENFPGFGRGTTGPQIVLALYNHAEQMGAVFIRDEVKAINLDGTMKELIGNSSQYTAKSIILAPGAEPKLLGVPGELELRGKGVSYCATCDAEFFRGMEVLVVGSGDAAIEEANYLTRFASKVTVVVKHEEGQVDANAIAFEKAKANKKINWIWHTVVDTINGQHKVESVTLRNLKSGATRKLSTSAVFILIGTDPKTSLFKGLLQLDEKGYIVTDEKMQTSIEGVYACGDARTKYLRQVVTAVSDGAIAAVAAGHYLNESEFFNREVLQIKDMVVVGYYRPDNEESLTVLSEVEHWLNEHSQVRLVRIDASRNELLTRRYQIKSVPMFHVFWRGQLIKTIVGHINQSELDQLLKSRTTDALAAK
ncbi:MAG: thioredoxin-disulfide reductase [Bacillota bacterium]|jgi:thioredoxin reductase (NADPH)